MGTLKEIRFGRPVPGELDNGKRTALNMGG